MRSEECGVRSEDKRRLGRPWAVHSAFRTPHSALRGFTLLEASLALVLSLMLVAAMLAFYTQVLSVRGNVVEEVQFLRTERLIMDRMTAELRGAVPGGSEFAGSDASVEFATAALPGPGVWAEPTATEQPPPAQQDLRVVSYHLLTEEDERGYPVVVGIARSMRTLVDPVPGPEEGVNFSTALLTDRFKFLFLRYTDGTRAVSPSSQRDLAEWAPNWSGRDLPVGIEITLGLEPLPENTDPLDYPYETFRRVVYIPAGRKATEEASGAGGAP